MKLKIAYAFSGFFLFRNLFKEIDIPLKVKRMNREEQDRFKPTCSRVFSAFFHLMLEDIIDSNGMFQFPDEKTHIHIKTYEKEEVLNALKRGAFHDLNVLDNDFMIHRLELVIKRPVKSIYKPIYASKYMKQKLIDNHKLYINED